MSLLCCGGPHGGQRHQRRETILEVKNRIKKFHKLQMKDDKIVELLDRFEHHSVLMYGIKVCQETDFKEMTGALGEFFIGDRMF